MIYDQCNSGKQSHCTRTIVSFGFCIYHMMIYTGPRLTGHNRCNWAKTTDDGKQCHLDLSYDLLWLGLNFWGQNRCKVAPKLRTVASTGQAGPAGWVHSTPWPSSPIFYIFYPVEDDWYLKVVLTSKSHIWFQTLHQVNLCLSDCLCLCDSVSGDT